MEQPMTPPPTITTRACLGRSAMASGSHAGVVGIEGRGGKDACAPGFALQQDVESAPGCCKLGIDAGEREALLHPMAIGAGSGHADAAAGREHGLTAAGIGVLSVDR